MLDCDVIIAGAGAVGSALAVDLRRRGFSIRLLEARKPDYAPSDPEREIALSAASIDYLRRLDCWAPLADWVGVIDHIRVREAGASGGVALDGESGAPLGAVVEMSALLEALHRPLDGALQALVAIDGFRVDDGAVTVSYTQDGSAHALRARLLVAADGSDSALRRMVGIATHGWAHNRYAVVASLRCGRSHGNTAYECFHHHGPLALLPMADGRFSLVWVVAPRRAAELMLLDDAAWLAALREAIPADIRRHIGEVRSASLRHQFALTLTIASRFVAPRLALVGNAAHTIHPVAGQGMNLGLRDAMALAQVVADHAEEGRDFGGALPLAHYADARRSDIAMTAGFTEGLLATFAVPGRAAALLRRIGMATMTRSGGLRRLLIDHATGAAQTAGGGV